MTRRTFSGVSSFRASALGSFRSLGATFPLKLRSASPSEPHRACAVYFAATLGLTALGLNILFACSTLIVAPLFKWNCKGNNIQAPSDKHTNVKLTLPLPQSLNGAAPGLHPNVEENNLALLYTIKTLSKELIKGLLGIIFFTRCITTRF